MSVQSEIKHLNEFLEKFFERGVIKKYALKPLTKAGDNFGSVLHALDVEIVDKSNAEKVNMKLRIIKHHFSPLNFPIL